MLMQTHSTFIPSTLPFSEIAFLVVFVRSKEKRLLYVNVIEEIQCIRGKSESPIKFAVPSISFVAFKIRTLLYQIMGIVVL